MDPCRPRIWILGLLVLPTLLNAQSPPALTEYPIPTLSSIPYGITTGPDGALWFTETGSAGNKIGRITTAGAITEYELSTPGSAPDGITTGPDGALWFVESGSNKIGRITTAGVITEFAIPTPNSEAIGITTGPDGALWFTECLGATIAQGYRVNIGRITTAGAVSEYPLFSGSFSTPCPYGITTGPDGALWFTEDGVASNRIGRITTAGAITEYANPSQSSQPSGITTGQDGALWFADHAGVDLGIGRITTAGAITEYATPSVSSQPIGITAGPDGALWFTEAGGNKIGRITTAGVITEYAISTPNSQPIGITTGPDGALWFTESIGNKIGRITTAGAVSLTISGASLPPGDVGFAYTAALTAFGGSPPYSNWTISSGSLPLGLALGPSTGAISGTPTSAGTFNFSVTVQDSTGVLSAAQSFSITVGQPCSYLLSSGGQAFAAAGGGGNIAITAAAGCAWSASGFPSWIFGATSGTGSGTLSYQVAANSGADRTAAMTVAGISYTVEQEAASISGLNFKSIEQLSIQTYSGRAFLTFD